VTNESMVIIGAGHAGCRAAEALRAHGWRGTIRLVEAEGRIPYQRPPLSKAVLAGSASISDSEMFPEGWLGRHEIDFRPGSVAKAIHRDVCRVELVDGSHLSYARLLLATGARARRPDIPGIDNSRVRFLRDAAGAEDLSSQLLSGAHLVIIGGGLIGMEAAASAITRGCAVTVIETAQRLLPRSAPPSIATMIGNLHEDAGVQFKLDSSVVDISGEDQACAVRLGDGTKVLGDVVLVCTGNVPNTELAESAGIAVDDGILVDPYLRTSDDRILAAGDACRVDDQVLGVKIRSESWKSAESQGELAGRNMLGAGVAYNSIPWMWSDQYDKVLQVTGYPDRGCSAVEREMENGSRLVFHLDESSHVVAVSGFGILKDVSRGVRMGQEMVRRRIFANKPMLEDRSIDLKLFVKAESDKPDR
jgi:3-phenylpropionate/trans-cinnamate dioxygenase ferredoxin reductase component